MKINFKGELLNLETATSKKTGEQYKKALVYQGSEAVTIMIDRECKKDFTLMIKKECNFECDYNTRWNSMVITNITLK